MKKTGRIMLVLLVLVVSVMLLYPSIKWHFLIPEETKELAAGTNMEIREYARGQASKDVRILLSMAKTNGEDAVPAEYKYLISDAKAELKKVGKSNPEKWTCYSLLSAFKTESSFFEAIEAKYREELMEVKELSNYVLQLGLDLRGGMSVLLEADTTRIEQELGRAVTEAELTALLNEDIEILNARIDQFGVSEPDIRLQGTSQILIELPGEADPERVNSFLRGKGSLAFQLVDSTLTDRVNSDYQKNHSLIFADDGTMITPSYIPADRTLAGYYIEDEYGLEVLNSLVVLKSEIALDGAHLKAAAVSQDPETRSPVVNFRLDSEGGEIFYKVTSANKGQGLAVVMDGKVKSVAKINEAIRDSVQLSGGFTDEEAQSLAVTLKTASLPVELVVVSQQAIGATLGDDAVKVALLAIVVGCALVFIFMAAYYGPAGLVSDVSLLMNFLMMISLLSALNFTLTLSSIAGIVLTLGMAIDANVIIYERMKEEEKKGALGYQIVREGYKGAFWSIMDSNVTTIIAALVLSFFGSSTVKGFANTLAIGIACSLFTSLFVSHLIFDLFIPADSFNRVKLSWRKRK
ncbi:MAG: protein translocase subunit SecD [Spirochaetales bacterium]|nr:protein translocase subunit SecD [Spirochaetales bacterium]